MWVRVGTVAPLIPLPYEYDTYFRHDGSCELFKADCPEECDVLSRRLYNYADADFSGDVSGEEILTASRQRDVSGFLSLCVRQYCASSGSRLI